MQSWQKINKQCRFVFGYVENHQYVFLLIILFANLYLKSLFIGEPSIWLDEASQVSMSKMSILGILNFSLETPLGPLYTILLKVWMKFFGMTEFSIRFLSMILHLGSVVLMFFFTKRFFNFQTLVFTLTFFTLSNVNIYYAQEARNYSMVVMLAIASFYFYMLLLEKATLARLIGYSLANIILLFTHLTPVLIFPVQFFMLLFYFKENKKGVLYIIAGQGITVLLLGIWFLNNHWFGGNETIWLARPTLDTVDWMYSYFVNDKLNLWFLYGIVVLWAVTTIISLNTVKVDWRRFSIIFLWSFVPVIIMFFASIYYNPRFIPKYLIYTTPAFYLFIALLLNQIKLGSFVKTLLFVAFSLVMINSLELRKQKDEDWKGAMQKYEALRTKKTATVLCPSYQSFSFLYYHDRDALLQDKSKHKAILSGDNVFNVDKIDQVLPINFNRYDQIILIYSHEKSMDPNGNILKYLDANYEFKGDYKFYNVSLYVFEVEREEISNTILVNFEDFPVSAKVIESNKARSGSKVALVNDKIEFSETITENLQYMISEGFSEISVSGWIQFSDPNTKAQLVVSIKGPDNSYAYESVDVAGLGNTNEWLNAKIKVPFPQNPVAGTEIKIYLWNQAKTTVLLDDLKITYE